MRSWLVTESGLGVIIVRVESHWRKCKATLLVSSLAWHVEFKTKPQHVEFRREKEAVVDHISSGV